MKTAVLRDADYQNDLINLRKNEKSSIMDFITDLPLSGDPIWVIVDTFTKMAHLIPLRIEAKKTDGLIKIFTRGYSNSKSTGMLRLGAISQAFS